MKNEGPDPYDPYVFGPLCFRISVCSWATTPEDVSRSVKSFVKARHEIQGTISATSHNAHT